MTIATQTGWMRNRLGDGLWENRGKVAVAGVEHSPVDRRWESGNFEASLGAYSILAARRALEDAGITADQVDGIVSAPGPIGDTWGPSRPYFAPPYDSEDGITKVTAGWLARGLGIDVGKLQVRERRTAVYRPRLGLRDRSDRHRQGVDRADALSDGQRRRPLSPAHRHASARSREMDQSLGLDRRLDLRLPVQRIHAPLRRQQGGRCAPSW